MLELTGALSTLGVPQVKDIIVKGTGDQQQAVGVRLADGRVFRGKAVVSNATRWDTFEKLLAQEKMPESERLFRQASPVSPAAWLPEFRSPALHPPPVCCNTSRVLIALWHGYPSGRCTASCKRAHARLSCIVSRTNESRRNCRSTVPACQHSAS